MRATCLPPVLGEVLDPLEACDKLEWDESLLVAPHVLQQELVPRDVGVGEVELNLGRYETRRTIEPQLELLNFDFLRPTCSTIFSQRSSSGFSYGVLSSCKNTMFYKCFKGLQWRDSQNQVTFYTVYLYKRDRQFPEQPVGVRRRFLDTSEGLVVSFMT